MDRRSQLAWLAIVSALYGISKAQDLKRRARA
jgi:cytoplasmic iron level regulating protein YaaA (DUF328/UPF0246 family)